MKAFWKRGMAVFLAALMMIQVPAMPAVQAQTISGNDVESIPEEAGTEQEEQADILPVDMPEEEEMPVSEDGEEEQAVVQADTISENSAADTLLNWIYVEKPYIKTPDTQNILVSIGNEETGILKGSLIYENTKTKERFELRASVEEGTVFGDSLLFSEDFTSTEEKGIYQLLEVSYETAEGRETIGLVAVAGIQAFFGVEEEVLTTEEKMEISTEVVTIDENGQETEANSIEEAIESAQAGITASRSDSLYARAGAKSNMVIVLDPGHDSTHLGASANGLKEEELTLKIAQYCKAQLETYSGVTVYLTRTGSACPYPGTTSTVCNSNRVAKAKSLGADVFVSIHLNSAASASASGAEVYYPNSNYNSEIGKEGNGLATEIQKKLVAIGLSNRGIKIRNSEDNTVYPDGSLADYYGVIKNSKLNGFPGIIIEHAFLTNSSDASLLSTEAGLKKLGVADAEGIAAYYNLSTSAEPAVEFSSGKLSILNKDLLAGTFTARIVDVSPYDKVSKVTFKVWTKSDKSDLKSYVGKDLGNGAFEASVSAAKHNNAEGKYYVYAYAVDGNNKETLLQTTSVTLIPAYTNVSVTRTVYGKQSQYYRVLVSGMEKAGKVTFTLWYSKSGSKTAVTYKAKKAASGKWYYDIPLSKMPKEGTYKLQIKATAAYGTEKTVKSVTFSYKRTATVSVAKTSSTQKKFKVQLAGMGYASKVSFQVWSKTGGKDDLKTYKGKKRADGTWAYNISISKHKTAGTYYVVAVAKVGNETVTLPKKSFKVTGPSVGSIKIQNKNTQAATFDVALSGIASPSGFSQKVEYQVWCKSDKSDKKTYKAKVKSDGTSKITVDVKNHNSNFGTYKIQVTLTDNNGIKVTLPIKRVGVTRPAANLSVEKTSSAQTKFKVTLEGMSYASKVSFQVWSKTGGKDDLKTYKGTKRADGTWAYNIPISKHKTAGTYYVVAVAQAGKETITLPKKSFKVTGPSVESIKIQNKNTQAMTFDVALSGISSPSGFSQKAEYLVWCKSDKSDKKTYKAKVQSDGSSVITVDVRNHKNNFGTYKVQVTLTDNNGITITLPIKRVGVTKPGTANYYPIMGTSETNVNQMVAYYNANAVYPAFYKNSDAPTIQKFCQLYVSESKAEGVKAEVAFVQAMKETNFLKYGGDVDISQYNFAGLGATGGGASGASFPSVQIGIRAQIQHLKAYATTEGLKNACVDSRYSLVTKGCAPYVQWLGIQENPTGKGWATDPGYGNDIVNRIAKLKTY
ncbi:MAG: hypothetical protein HDR01_00585 [Lachnospiraceae bacterium]|nr:hypothetical protein [Lachnospiraceae bacterium]